MAFRVKDNERLKVETDRVQGIILMSKYADKEWTPESLRKELSSIGLEYSKATLSKIISELQTRGITDDVVR